MITINLFVLLLLHVASFVFSICNVIFQLITYINSYLSVSLHEIMVYSPGDATEAIYSHCDTL